MADTRVVEEIPQLGRLGNVVPEGYEYYEKVVMPGEGLVLPSAYLKWYDIYPPDVEISREQVAESRAFLEAEVEAGRLILEGDLGFVLLHRAGGVLLLLVTTWRNTNEMWESVYVKVVGQARGYEPVLHEGSHRATYCVWELGPVWHERGAWVRFIASKRDEEAKLAYVNDRFEGRV
ncbi:MAG: hypothetical protein WCD37_09670 [Chloroflexia bacterium]